MNDNKLKELNQLGSVNLPFLDCAILLDIDHAKFIEAMENKESAEYMAYHKGRLNTVKTLRILTLKRAFEEQEPEAIREMEKYIA